MRRVVSVLVVIAVLLAAATALYFVPAVQDGLLNRAVHTGATERNDLLTKDAMRVLLCGTRGPLPHPTRAETCVAVFAGGRWFLVDAGQGSWNNLALWQIPAAQIGAAFMTHVHSDHIGELGEINTNTWIAGRSAALRVFGPEGLEQVTHGFNTAYAIDRRFRIAHHGAALLKPAAAPLDVVTIPLRANSAPKALVYDADGVRVIAFLVNHAPATPAFGYRFEYGGRSVVISGDTVSSQAVSNAADGADVLLHEALAAHMLPVIADAARAAGRAGAPKLLADIPSYHTTPVQAATIANKAKVRALVLYHLVPAPRNDLMERVFMRGVSAVRPDTQLGDDGMLITLPVKSTVVQFGHI